MKITVLDAKAMGEDLDFSALEKYGEVTVYRTTANDEVAGRIQDCDIVITNKNKITKSAMQVAKRLRLVCVFATGYDNIDVAYAKERGIGVCNVPAYSTESVALYTFATALSLLTHLKEYNEFVVSGAYSEGDAPNKLTPVYHELIGKTWGIVGCGNIGGRVAEIASVFGARVIVYQRHEHAKYQTVSFDTLCRESDIISLHCPLSDATRALIDAQAIEKMKSDVILVNEARGAVVDENAVADAIEAEQIGAYGCDVYSAEPFPTEHPFYRIRDRKNVLLTPHAAWGAYEARARCLKIIGQNIADFLEKKTTNRVDIM